MNVWASLVASRAAVAAAVAPLIPGRDAAVEPIVAGLVQYGPLGIILAWLMFRVEDRLKEQVRSNDRVRQAINRLAMAHLLEVATREEAPPVVKQQATAMLDEIRAEQLDGVQGGAGKSGVLQ